MIHEIHWVQCELTHVVTVAQRLWELLLVKVTIIKIHSIVHEVRVVFICQD